MMLVAFAKKLHELGVSSNVLHRAFDMMELEGMQDPDIDGNHMALEEYLKGIEATDIPPSAPSVIEEDAPPPVEPPPLEEDPPVEEGGVDDDMDITEEEAAEGSATTKGKKTKKAKVK